MDTATGRTVHRPTENKLLRRPRLFFLVDFTYALNQVDRHLSIKKTVEDKLKRLKISLKDVRPNTILATQVQQARNCHKNFHKFLVRDVISLRNSQVFRATFYQNLKSHMVFQRQVLTRAFINVELLKTVKKTKAITPIDFLHHKILRQKILLHQELLLKIKLFEDQHHEEIHATSLTDEPIDNDKIDTDHVLPKRKRKHHRKNFNLRQLIISVSFFVVLINHKFIFRNIRFTCYVVLILRLTVMFFNFNFSPHFYYLVFSDYVIRIIGSTFTYRVGFYFQFSGGFSFVRIV